MTRTGLGQPTEPRLALKMPTGHQGLGACALLAGREHPAPQSRLPFPPGRGALAMAGRLGRPIGIQPAHGAPLTRHAPAREAGHGGALGCQEQKGSCGGQGGHQKSASPVIGRRGRGCPGAIISHTAGSPDRRRHPAGHRCVAWFSHLPAGHRPRWKESGASVSRPRARAHPGRPLRLARPGRMEAGGCGAGLGPPPPCPGPYLVQLALDVPQKGYRVPICLEGCHGADGLFQLQQRPSLQGLAARNGAGRVFIAAGVGIGGVLRGRARGIGSRRR